MQRLPGRPLTEMSHISYESVLGQVGEYLAQVHRLTARQYGYIGAHRPMEPENSWVDAFQMQQTILSNMCPTELKSYWTKILL